MEERCSCSRRGCVGRRDRMRACGMSGDDIKAKVDTGREGGVWTWEDEEGGGLLERQEE